MELVKVETLNDIKLYDGPIDEEYNTVDYHLDFKEYLFKDVSAVVEAFILIKEKATYTFHIIVETENRNFDEADFAFFLELEAELEDHGLALAFDGGYKNDYTLLELMEADALLDRLINYLNNSSYSPFEKYLYIYDHLANKKYKQEDVFGEDVYKPRDIIAITNGDYIVCEGYARLMKYLCKNVGITCILQVLANHQGTEKHMNNLVYLDDDNYDIHGLYYSDVTWDSIGKNGQHHTFAFCLVPMADIKEIRTDLDFSPFYMIFQDPKKAAIRVIDSDAPSFVGEQISPNFYIPSLAEDLFDISDQVKESYDMALNLYLKRRIQAINTVKEMFLEKDVPGDAYERQAFTPFGSSLPFLIATLCYNPKAYSIVENGINRLLRHLKTPLDEEGGPFEGEQMPYYRTSNLYLALDALNEMSDEEINHPLDELRKLDNELSKKEFQFGDDYDSWMANKKIYDNLMLVLHKLRNMLLYKTVKDLIVAQYPHGKPIRLISFFRALERILMSKGFSESEALTIIRKYFKDSTILAKNAFGDAATNCFKTNTDRY